MRAPELREHGVCRKGLFREEGKPSSLFFLRRRRAEARGAESRKKEGGAFACSSAGVCAFFRRYALCGRNGRKKRAEESVGKAAGCGPDESPMPHHPAKARERGGRGLVRAGRKTARPEPAGEAHAGAQAGVYAGLKPEFLNLELKPDSGRSFGRGIGLFPGCFFAGSAWEAVFFREPGRGKGQVPSFVRLAQ